MELINASEAARRAGVSREWISRLCAQGRIEGARKLGRGWSIPAGAKIAKLKPRTYVLRATEIPRAGKK